MLPRTAYRQAQRTYLKLLLSWEVCSDYTVVGEEEPEKHCKGAFVGRDAGGRL